MKKSMHVVAAAMVLVFLAGCNESQPPQDGSRALYENLDGSKLKESAAPEQKAKNPLFGSLEGSKLKRSSASSPNGQDK